MGLDVYALACVHYQQLGGSKVELYQGAGLALMQVSTLGAVIRWFDLFGLWDRRTPASRPCARVARACRGISAAELRVFVIASLRRFSGL